jgi:hypothetical protein
MSGVYTELAKKRAEQSNGPTSQGVVPPLSEKPGVQEAPVTAQSKETRKQGYQETRKLGNAEQAVTESQGFDLNIVPYKNGTFLFTYEELDAIDDLKNNSSGVWIFLPPNMILSGLLFISSLKTIASMAQTASLFSTSKPRTSAKYTAGLRTIPY